MTMALEIMGCFVLAAGATVALVVPGLEILDRFRERRRRRKQRDRPKYQAVLLSYCPNCQRHFKQEITNMPDLIGSMRCPGCDKDTLLAIDVLDTWKV